VPDILIVEDEALVAHDLELSLKRMGYGVSGVASSTEEALAAVAQQEPDLVLMDIRLRGVRDGVETASLLRERHRLPVVYLTAYADDTTLERAKLTEPFGYLLKPWNPRELRSTVEIALYVHRIQTQLREREHWFSTTLKAIDDAVVAVSPDGAVRFLNARAETLLGLTEAEARGRPLSALMRLVDADTGAPIPDPATEAMARLRSVELPPNAMLGGRAVDDSAAPILDDEGRLLGAVLVARDSTERRRLLAEIARNDRLRALGSLAAGVGHEIANALTYLQSSLDETVERLRRAADDASGPPLADALEEAVQGAERIRGIAEDLRTFARPGREASAPIDLTRCVDWALRATRREVEARACLRSEIQAVPPVMGNAARVEQVLINLLRNAAQAVPPGGPAAQEVLVRAHTDERGWAVLTVRDTGIGIGPEQRDRIFEPFFTTKETARSSGLGLAVCRSIVESLGGEIGVSSEPGRGTCFAVSLPPAPAVRAAAPPRQEPVAFHARVLVVDDDAGVRRTLERFLGPHEVVSCAGGQEALERLAVDRRFDLILCDVTMPRVDGPTLFARVSEQWPELRARIVFVTGGAADEAAAAFLDGVPNRRLLKPVRLVDVAELLRDRLGAGP
jgi:hypothetical protein